MSSTTPESEVVISKKSDTEIEVTDSRERPKVTLKIPGLYNLRKENAPVVGTLVSPAANTTYYVYATKPASGGSLRSQSGFDLLFSTDDSLFAGYKMLGTVVTDGDGKLIDIVGHEEETEHLLDKAIPVDLGKSWKKSAMLRLNQIPSTAKKVKLACSIRTAESEYGVLRLYALGESQPVDYLQSEAKVKPLRRKQLRFLFPTSSIALST